MPCTQISHEASIKAQPAAIYAALTDPKLLREVVDSRHWRQVANWRFVGILDRRLLPADGGCCAGAVLPRAMARCGSRVRGLGEDRYRVRHPARR